MVNFDLQDTITAISTPVGKGGIGIVRMSGPDAINIADKVFRSKNGRKVRNFKSYTIHYGWIVDRHQTSDIRHQTSDFNTGQKKNLIHTSNQQPVINSQVIDEVLLSVMRAPKTYTREDIVEISCHSGIVVLKKILELLLTKGARLAKPGEFTQRAFINGRIDLAQAEAVLDLIESRTERGANLAVEQLEGKISQKISEIREELLEVYVQLEAFIDFPEEDIEVDIKQIRGRIFKIADQIEKIIKKSEKGCLIREGKSIVLCGKPNVGKSSLMNALLRKDRVIVTPFPGTTRDTIEESISIEGIPFRLIDTAGVISSDDVVEQAGVERSKKHLKISDFIILVLDSSEHIDEQDIKMIQIIKDKSHIVVLNKIDLPSVIEIKDIEKYGITKIVKLSALKEEGIDDLERSIVNSVWSGEIEDDGLFITNKRHKKILEETYRELQRVEDLKEGVVSIELLSIDIKCALDKLGEIAGQVYTEDMLDRIFSQFCIGK